MGFAMQVLPCASRAPLELIRQALVFRIVFCTALIFLEFHHFTEI